MNTKLTQVQAKTAALVQQVRLAPVIKTAWLKISDVMAIIDIESGFNATVPASDFARTGSIGLGQVEAAVAKQVLNQYAGWVADSKLPVIAEQTDPLTSIVTSMLVLYQDRGVLATHFGSNLSYEHLTMAYNEGAGNVIKGVSDWSYYAKWSSAKMAFEFLDAPAAKIVL